MQLAFQLHQKYKNTSKSAKNRKFETDALNSFIKKLSKNPVTELTFMMTSQCACDVTMILNAISYQIQLLNVLLRLSELLGV